MPKRKTKSSSGGRGIAALMLIAALGVGAFAAYVRFTPAAQHVAPEDRRALSSDDAPRTTRSSHHSDTDDPDVSATATGDVKLRIPTVSGMDVSLGRYAGPVPDGVKPIVFITNETLRELKLDERAKAIGVDVRGRSALIDFTPDLEQGFGSIEEGTLVKALQTALGQFPEIYTFQLVIEGKTLTTLGELDLADPIPVIRPGASDIRQNASASEPSASAEPEPQSKPSSDPKAPPED